jgi:hypothetical protein
MQSLTRLTAPLVLSCALATTAQATTLLKMSTEQMTARATDIVVGTVTGARSVWVDRTLVTLAKVSVAESLKGAAPSELTVVLPGGVDTARAVPVAVTWPGAPVLKAREDVVLFLEADAPVKDGYQIVGFSQGKFSVVRDAFGRTLAAQSRSASGDAVDLASFKNRIRELVRKGGDAARSDQ